MTLSSKAAKKLSPEQSNEAVPWQAPPVSEAIAASAIAHLPTARELEALQKQAHDEAFAQGLQEGREEGAREVRKDLLAAHRREALRLEAFLDALGQPLAEVTASVEKEILALVVAMARQIIRRELKTSPDEIVGTVRDALGQLPIANREVRVELHPEDAALIRDRLQDRQQGTKRWTIVEDPLIARGGCRVTSDDSLIDATLDSRIGALVSRVFGEQRNEEAARKERAEGSTTAT
ncbi:MAG: flagellar assembly protein FliH [Pseudomonadota bacterium]